MNPLRDTRSAINLGRRYLRSRDRTRRAIRANRVAYYEEAWRAAAKDTGSTIDSLGGGYLRVSRSGRNAIVFEQYTPLNDAATNHLVRDREVIFGVLDRLEMPRPRYVRLERNAGPQALGFMGDVGAVAVKPASGTGAGAGVVTNVSDRRTLTSALSWAGAFGGATVIEEQLAGRVHRLLFLDGELLDTVVRKSPMLTGDGVSTVRRLIALENERRAVPGARLAQSPIHVDLDTVICLRDQGLRLSTKVAAGRRFTVKNVINDNRADENEAPEGGVHRSFAALGGEIGEALGLRLFGLDVIASSVAVDLHQSGGRVIEINTPPGHFYHDLRRDAGRPIAPRLLERMLRPPGRYEGG